MTNPTVSVQVQAPAVAPRGAALLGGVAAVVCRALKAVPGMLALYVVAHRESRHA